MNQTDENNLSEVTDGREQELNALSESVEHDVATLHIDTNIWHTIKQVKITTSSNAIDKLLTKDCSCSLREIFFSTPLRQIDVNGCSIETQLELLTKLASERFDSTCSTDVCDTINIKCFFSREICISRWNVTEEDTSKFKSETSEMPVDLKLQLACLVTDHHYVKDIMEEATDTDLNEKNVLFYGISDESIVDLLVKSGVEVNTRDARGRSPIFYALTTSLNSAKCLLNNGALVTLKDNCSVSVLTFFAETVMNNTALAPEKDYGIQLLSTKGIKRAKMIKEIINLIFCKFIQVLGTMFLPSNSHKISLNPSMLCETLKWILPENESNDNRNDLINQLQSMKASDTRASNGTLVDVVPQIFDILHKLGAQPSSPDSEGNTCLHYATHLLFNGVPKETVMHICDMLNKLGVNFNTKNHENETPLLFCLSSKGLIANEPKIGPGCLQDICKFLLEHGSKLGDTTYKEESVFHLTLKLCQQAVLLTDENQKHHVFREMFKILEMFSMETKQRKVAVNRRDIHLNSPLHLWASLALTSASDYDENVFDDYRFEHLLKALLDPLLRCGVKLDNSNENDETPLHVCRTWCAVKLLLETGANPSAMDSAGRKPLLAAAKNNTGLKKRSDRFYPDVVEQPKEFWKNVLDKKLDPWTADKTGESVLSILIEKDAFHLAKALLEVACEENYVQSDTIGIPLMDAICKDKSTDKVLKSDLVMTLLKSRRSLAYGRLSNEDTALHFCCRNILEIPENSLETSVQWNIVQHLLVCGANSETAGETGQSCLELAENCPILKDLLSTPVNTEEVAPLIDTWTPVSVRHKCQLAKVARGFKCRQIETRQVYYYNEPLDNGTFGLVFIGINSQDGKEVAVKRIEQMRIERESDKVEIEHLSLKVNCNEVVEYLYSTENKYFFYVYLELMEGNLDDLLSDEQILDRNQEIKLCKDILKGLEYLHRHDIIHRGFKPNNILYCGVFPTLCLKLAFFGLRCQMTEQCSSTFTDRRETLTNTRCWMAPEVLQSQSDHSKSSDIFSCGLVIHYLVSVKKHPFAPTDCSKESSLAVNIETVDNIIHNQIGLDESISTEANELVRMMLDKDKVRRPNASQALAHRFF